MTLLQGIFETRKLNYNNKDFCSAFFAIKKNHAQLAEDYFHVKEEIFEMFRKEGYTVSEDERFCTIGKDHKLVKTNNNMESYFLLQRELEKEEYQVILMELETALKQYVQSTTT